MLHLTLQVLALFAVPIFLHNALKDKTIAKWLSPVVVCYIVGICLGTFAPQMIDESLSIQARDLSIVLAIPLLLMTSNFIAWLPKAKGLLGAFFVSALSVLIATLACFAYFHSRTDEAWMIGGMVFAGFTGTSPNLNAVGRALECPEDTLLLVNLGDIISSGIYLIFLTSVAHPILSRFLPAYKPYSGKDGDAPDMDEMSDTSTMDDPDDPDSFSYMTAYRMKRFGFYILPVLISAGILALTVGAEMILFPAEGLEGTFLILSVTLLGIAASFAPGIRKLRSSYRIGQYLLLVFCVALGSLINAETVLKASPLILTFVSLILLGSVLLNILLARLFGIDADTVIITSTSTIYGPAFIGQVAMAMKNREIVFSGMIASMVGIALGNFLGIALAYALQGFN